MIFIRHHYDATHGEDVTEMADTAVEQGERRGTGRVIGYWGVTGLLCAELLAGGFLDVLRTHYAVGIVVRLGYPPYILTVLGLWKLLAIPALLAPGFTRLKEWAYAGIFFDMTGAAVSHAACGEGKAVIAPLVIAVLAMVSWWLRPASRRCEAFARAEAMTGER
ncbi:MAG: DoxX family protein [Acidobacteriaceae bacterium]